MAGTQSLAPIVLWDHTQAGIRWRVSIHPELVREGGTVVRFLKQGRSRKLLDQLREWGPQGWICPPSAKVPTDLLERIERELQRRTPPSGASVSGGAKGPCRAMSVRGDREVLSCGRMSFTAFLAMELIEADLPDVYRLHTAPAR